MNKAININKCKNAEINYTTVELVDEEYIYR